MCYKKICHQHLPVSTVYENISLYNSHQNNLDSALAYSKKALAEKDSLTNLSVSKQIAELETKYETEKKERIISDQKNELNTKKVQLQERQLALTKQRYMIAGLAGLLLFLTLVAYLFYRRYQWQQQQRLQIALFQERERAATTVIVAEEKERKRIAQDLHDGVGQTLSAIKMNLTAYSENVAETTNPARLKLDRIISLVDDSCKEVRSVSHNMMPNALLKKSLASAVAEFVDKLDDKALKIHLYTEGLDDPLNMNVETVLYRVIQESINNVIKHSGADTVDIALIKDNKEITATIEDNGKGFSKDKTSKGLGIENMKTRIEYLNGKMTIDSSEGAGTVIAVVVPLKPSALS